MALTNDEDQLKRCLENLIERFDEIVVNFNDKIFDSIENEINDFIQISLSSLSKIIEEYLSYLFQDSIYSFQNKTFKQKLSIDLLKQFGNHLRAIRYSLDAFPAAFFGNFDLLKEFLENYPQYKDKCGIYGTTLLYSSARNDHFHIVKYLIEQVRCNVNQQNKQFYSSDNQPNPISGSTPLHVASYYGHLHLVQYLIGNGADYFILNDAKETPILNGLSRENIKDFFQDYLICSYSNSTDIIPQNTILEEDTTIEDSIWEMRSFSSNQWNTFHRNQSKELQQSLHYRPNHNYNQLLPIEINKQPFEFSLTTFLLSDRSKKNSFWIRCRGSSFLNFNCSCKWQIIFDKCVTSSKENKSSLRIFQLPDQENPPIEIKLNHWYNVNSFIQQQIEHGINFRRKIIQISLPFIHHSPFTFHLKEFSFSNQDQTFVGSIRWIPLFLDTNQFIIQDNFQPLDDLFLTPMYRKITSSNHQNGHSEMNANVQMDVRYGDLIKEKSDVIVVCWSSRHLLELIYDSGGSSVRNAINYQLKHNLKNVLTSVEADGDIQAKRIYFVHWQSPSDTQFHGKSLEDLINISMKKACEEHWMRISFPAIGCGDFHCSPQLIVRTMVYECHQQQFHFPISISFIIQSNRKDLFDQFSKEISLLKSSISSNSISMKIDKSLIEIEKGDLTKQKVDAIVVSSVSDDLKQIILIEAGSEIYEMYEKEKNSNPNSLFISIPAGNLSCQRIFFVKWNPEDNPLNLRQSISDFVSNVIQNVQSHQYNSIAFPSIGCGHSNISSLFIIQTFIQQLIIQIKTRNLALLIKFVILPDQNQIYQLFYQQISNNQQSIDEIKSDDKVPETWQISGHGEQFRFNVQYDSDEYKQIANPFIHSMKGKLKRIIRIERIQNERWFFQYLAHKNDFFKRLNRETEQRLYHGCPQNVLDSIIEDCFNRSFAGVNGTMYGVGVYFSSDPIYSNQFSKPNSNGEKSMFVARVLIGNTTLGNPTMKTRPPGFDTTTDGKHIFVTYHDAQAYAEYLIIYK